MNTPRTALAAALLALAGSAHAQWVTLTDAGTPVLSAINPKTVVVPQPATCTNTGLPPEDVVRTQSATRATAKFAGLPGSTAMPGFVATPIRSATTNLVTGGITVGTLYDRVYCTGSGSTCDGTNTYVFALRAILNTNISPSGETFEINDYFRVVPTSATGIQAGYYMGAAGGTPPNTSQAFKYLEFSGRTNNGLGQPISRNQGFVNFRVDTNALDGDACAPFSSSSANSPWLYARLRCPNGVSTAPVSQRIRVRQGGEEGQPPVSISVRGFVCN